MSLGITKNGALYGDAVVFRNSDVGQHAAPIAKRLGYMPGGRIRLAAVQHLALLEDDRWLKNAERANREARRLADRLRAISGVVIPTTPEANIVLGGLPEEVIVPLQQWSLFFRQPQLGGLVRWVASHDTSPEDVDRFVAGVEAVIDRAAPGDELQVRQAPSGG